MMGETGQGCMSEEEINKEKNNNLTRTWGQCEVFLDPKRRTDLSIEEVKKKCPWYFTLKGLISERPNLVPVGLGNNAAEYNTMILLNQGDNGAGPSNTGDDPLSADELKGTAEDQELEDDLNSFNKNAIDPSSPDSKVTVKEKTAVKKEGVVSAKRPRSQVDRIADAEIARFECKKAKLEVDQRRFKTVENVALVKAQEKTRRIVEIRQAELDLKKEKMRMDHEYRMEMLRLGQILPSSPHDSHPSTSSNSSQPNPAAWHPISSFSSVQPHTVPQSSVPVGAPSLENFPLQSPECSSSDHRNSPEPESDLFGETSY